MISERPAEAADRAVPGHWEGDLIIGKDCKSAVGTLAGRSTRYVLLLHLPGGRGAGSVDAAMRQAIATLPGELFRTLTWDQGKEIAYHAQFTIDTGIQVYFCDPHKPWQRGSNENTNGLLRQYLPKGTDLSAHSAEDIARIARSLNNRPRKTLGYMKPSEKLAELVATPVERAVSSIKRSQSVKHQAGQHTTVPSCLLQLSLPFQGRQPSGPPGPYGAQLARSHRGECVTGQTDRHYGPERGAVGQPRTVGRRPAAPCRAEALRARRRTPVSWPAPAGRWLRP